MPPSKKPENAISIAPPTQELPLRYLMVRYTLVLLTTIAGMHAIDYVFCRYLGGPLPPGANVVTIMVPAVDAGMALHRKLGHRPDGPAAWKIVGLLTLISSTAGVAVLVAAVVTGVLPSQLGPIPLFVIALTVAVAVAVCAVVTRLFLGMGLKLAERQQEQGFSDTP